MRGVELRDVHALHDCTKSWFACGSSTVVFVLPWRQVKLLQFKFFVHFLLEVFPRNRLRSSMDYGLTQSQVGIVGLKIVNSLNRINRCIKFTAENGTDLILVNLVVFFTALWTF